MNMTRRAVIGMAGAGATVALGTRAFASQTNKPAAPAIPDWMMREIRLAKARFCEWKGADETLVFPVVSDVHSGTVSLGGSPDWSDGMVHQYALDAAAKIFGADFIANLGDIGLDRGRKTWRDEPEAFGRAVMDCERRIYDTFSVPSLHVIGNHDLGNVIWHQSSDDYFRFFNSALEAASGFRYAGDGYGLWDFPRKMTRVIFLNTSELNVGNTKGKTWVGVTQRQVDFLDRSLGELKDGWTAVILSHATLHPYLGLWRSSAEPCTTPGLANALAAVERHAKAGRIRIAGSFAGHAHLDADVTENGVRHVITQSYGLNGPENLRPMYRFNRINLAASMLIDVVAVKPYRSQVKVFRIGCGGEQCDRVFPSRCHGAKSFAVEGTEVRIVSSSYPRPRRLRLRPEDFAKQERMAAWVEDGVRFVWIDNSGHDVDSEQDAYFRREAAKGEGVVLLLAKPFFMPGMSPEDAPCANPLSKPRHEWRTYAFRESAFLYTQNLLGVFAPATGKSFVASDNGCFQYAFTKGATMDVAIN